MATRKTREMQNNFLVTYTYSASILYVCKHRLNVLQMNQDQPPGARSGVSNTRFILQDQIIFTFAEAEDRGGYKMQRSESQTLGLRVHKIGMFKMSGKSCS